MIAHPGSGHNGCVHLPETPFDLTAIGSGLVFADVLDDLARALTAEDAAAVVQGPPGTGKTTLVPPLVANLAGGRVIVTQPRRVAARAAARRLHQLCPDLPTGAVAFSVRGESTTRPSTIIEFVTPGILINRLLADPELTGVSAVILDEVHERALDSDLALAMLLDVRELRGDMRLLALSATLDAARFSRLMDGAPVIDSPTALHPLTEQWAPPPGPRLDDRGVTPAFLEHVAATAADAHRTHPDSDVLVFLPGAREVSRCADGIRDRLTDSGVEVLELHGQVPPREQDRIVSGGDAPGRRIIVSTALAESSLTVPGVRVVVDSALAREPRRDSLRRMTGLVTLTASKASMTQRAGRAARLGPGTVIRCCDPSTAAGAAQAAAAEVTTADLTGAMLTAACWGAPGGEGLRMLEPFNPRAAADARTDLTAIDALMETGHATELGRMLAAVPTDPRLARALLDSASAGEGELAADVIALLGADGRPASLEADRALAAARGDRKHQREAERLRRIAARSAGTGTGSGSSSGSGTGGGAGESGTDPDAVGRVIARAFPLNIARRMVDGPDGAASFLLASGTRVGVPAGHLATQEWIVVAHSGRSQARAAAGTGAVARLAAAISEETALSMGEHLLADRVTTRFTEQGAQARRIRSLGAITLSSAPARPEGPEARAAVIDGIREQGLGAFRFSDAARSLRERVQFLHRTLGEPWPDLSDAAIIARLDDVAAPELDRLAGIGGKPVRPSAIDMLPILQRLLPWPAAGRLRELAPERLEVPSGSAIRLTYPPLEEADGADASDGAEHSAPGRVVAEVKLQEMFGLAQSPRIADGAASIQFHLLSPARRPLAVTDDLASFWDGAYAQVRAEMRGRYPKHPWPEDPWSAEATARTKRRPPR